MQVTVRDGTTIGWDERGTGRPVLLVHGGANDSEAWSLVRQHLSDGIRVAAVDRRGRGRSGRGGDAYTLDVEADDLLAVAEALGGDVLLVGHSIGATIALQALRRGGKHLTGAVLYEPPLPGLVPPAPPEMVNALDDGRHEDALEAFLRHMVRLSPDEIASFQASPAWPRRVELIWTMRREGQALMEYDADLAQYQSVDQAVELLVGDRTAPHHTEAVEALQATLPRAHTTILHGQGHGALLQDPGAIAASINSAAQ